MTEKPFDASKSMKRMNMSWDMLDENGLHHLSNGPALQDDGWKWCFRNLLLIPLIILIWPLFLIEVFSQVRDKLDKGVNRSR